MIAETILTLVSEKYDIPISVIQGRSRRMEIVEARMLFCLLMNEATNLTYNSIGKFINRDHATVIHSIERAKNLVKIYPRVESRYKEIKSKII